MSCAALALASTVAAPRDAYAQAFNGDFASGTCDRVKCPEPDDRDDHQSPTRLPRSTGRRRSNDFPASGQVDPGFHQPRSAIIPFSTASRRRMRTTRSSSTAVVISTSRVARPPAATSGSTARAGSSSARAPMFDVGGLLLTSLTPASSATTPMDSTPVSRARPATAERSRFSPARRSMRCSRTAISR